MELLEIVKIRSKDYGIFSVGLDVHGIKIPLGSLTLVGGPNFSGVTILLRSLSGQTNSEPEAIEFSVTWTNGSSRRPFKPSRDAVYLGPDPVSFFSGLTDTIMEEVDLNFSSSEIDRSNIVDKWLKVAGLQSLGDRHPFELSGGQAAALALACGFALGRPVICVDGLLSHLDCDLRQRASEALRSYATLDAVVLVGERQVDALFDLTDYVILLRSGQANDIFSTPGVFVSDAAKMLGVQPSATRLAMSMSEGECNSDFPTTKEQFIDWFKHSSLH